MAQSQVDVAIIGAGSTGLLLAQGLKHAGVTFQIFERHASDFVSREWSMSLHWGGEFLSKALPLELRTRLHEIDVDPHHDASKDTGFIQCNGETGDMILMMQGTMPRRVSRRKLKTFMSEGLDIQFNKKLETIALGVDYTSAKFSDGTLINAKLIVGCDGSRSKVREILIQDQKLSANISLEYTLLNFPCSFSSEVSEKLRDVHPVFKVAYHPKHPMMYLLTMSDSSSSDPAEWKHQILISWAGPPYAAELSTPESRMKRLKEVGPVWAHPWSTAALNVSENTTTFVDTGSNWDPRPMWKADGAGTSWNGHDWQGRVTLAGDAAHTMLPHRGQGLNNALQDAAELLTLLKNVFVDKSTDLASAVRVYEEEMVARGGLEVEVTGKQSKAAHDWNLLMQSPIFKHGAHKSK